MTTDDLVEQFMRSRRNALLRPATIEWYHQILPRFAAAAGQHPTTADIEDFIGSAPSPETGRNWLRAIRALYNWAELTHGRPNPARRAIKPRGRASLPRILRPAEITTIYRVARLDPVDLAAYSILLDTGVRIGELASLRIEDVDIPRQDPHATDRERQAYLTVRGKTGERRVPISPLALRTILPIAPLSGALFQYLGHPVTARTLMHRIRRLFKRSGITGPKTGPHTIRHTYATLYLRNGGDLHRLMRLLGHTSLQHTRVYLHLNDEDMATNHATLSPLNLVVPRQLPLGGGAGPLQQTFLEESS